MGVETRGGWEVETETTCLGDVFGLERLKKSPIERFAFEGVEGEDEAGEFAEFGSTFY